VAAGTIDLMPMVTHRYELARGIDAFELLRERKGVKALILPHG
jgi:threonine dehydrogenase-like Zn-dependent dehydrogenase